MHKIGETDNNIYSALRVQQETALQLKSLFHKRIEIKGLMVSYFSWTVNTTPE